MNKNILNTGSQNFISKNLNTDIVSVLLKKGTLEGVSSKELAEQIESKKKCKNKLPIWYATPLIYYPNKLNIEQTSSEITAQYKAQLVNGKTLIDVTGGFGIDSYYFAQKVKRIYHCEINENLSKIAAHNFKILGVKNIKNSTQNGITFLAKFKDKIDWVFIDPSRRNNVKGKVFQLADCLPNVPDNLDLILKKSNNILIKTSPLLDFSIGIKELQFVKEIHVVAVHNDVKELLWILEKSYAGEIKIKTVNLKKEGEEFFEFVRSNEKKIEPKLGLPESYLYEPNSSILKAGGFKSIGHYFGLKKLQEHSHLYTSKSYVNFPGRCFKIESIHPYNKKELQKLGILKANITTRNFPETVASIRKKLKIKDGGDIYLFFTKNRNNKNILIVCSK